MSDERDETSGSGEEPDPTTLVGEVLAGRYRVLRRLGVGAMGAVYLGEHMRIGRKDAIKVLRAGMAQDPEAIARFTRGARNVSRIRHPNVCTLYDFGDTDEGFHFLAMEYVDGPTLGSLLETQGALSLERTAELIRQVGEALYAAHSLGIVHRDLKPDNIMVARERDGSERVKVVDFDIARGPAEEEGPAVTRHGFVVGTPEYMSPEQLTGDPLDGRSDIYSMALVLFRMLTERLPFEGDTAQEIMVQRLTREPMTLQEAAGRSFPEALELAVAEGLRRKAAERPPDARAFAQNVLKAIQDAGPLPSGPAPPTAEGPKGGEAPPPTVAPSASATGGFEPPSSPPADAGSGETPSAPSEEGGGRGRRTGLIALLAGLAVVMVLFVGGGLLAAWLWFGPIGGDDDTVAGPDDVPAEVADAGDFDPELPPPGVDDDPEVPPAASDSPEGAAVQEAGGEETREPDPVTPADDPTPQPTEPAPTPEEADEPAVSVTVDPSDARDFLFRQFQATGPEALPEDPQAQRATLLAVRDTLDAVWRMEGISREDRAFAAWVLGHTLVPLGDSIEALQWFEEAVRLDPIERYIDDRDAHRGGRP